MPQDRFYAGVPFSEGSTIELQDEEFHHLTRVMRVKEGETIELVNGQGELAAAVFVEQKKKSAVLEIQTVTAGKPTQPLILAQAIPRLNRLDIIVEKGTELGMTELWLFPGALSERKEFSATQMERLQTIAISAMKQCGRLFLPLIRYFPSMQKCPLQGHALFFGDLSPQAPSLINMPKPKSSVIFIGPEKGLAEEEIEWLIQNHALGVKLHDNILRTDTAAIVSLALFTA